MKIKVFALLTVSLMAVLISGCVTTVDGHVKPGDPFRKDKLVSRYERTVPQVFEAAKAVLMANGQLQADNHVNNSLVAKVDTRTVFIKVEESEPTVSKITVQVRTAAGGVDVDLASELDKQIALRLSQGH